MRFLLIVALLATPVAVVAQDQSQAPKPATKLEAFQATTGIVMVRGYTTIGTLRGMGGVVSVDAREFRDASSQARRVTGISISVEETGRLERENTSFIDADEIDGLIQGLEYISKVTKDITNFENFEAEFRTKGDFSVVVFNDSSGQLSLAVSSGRIGKTTAFLKLAQLSELKQLVIAAKSQL
jgi:hypothetical protein